jgi:hypothetical protein
MIFPEAYQRLQEFGIEAEPDDTPHLYYLRGVTELSHAGRKDEAIAVIEAAFGIGDSEEEIAARRKKELELRRKAKIGPQEQKRLDLQRDRINERRRNNRRYRNLTAMLVNYPQNKHKAFCNDLITQNISQDLRNAAHEIYDGDAEGILRNLGGVICSQCVFKDRCEARIE